MAFWNRYDQFSNPIPRSILFTRTSRHLLGITLRVKKWVCLSLFQVKRGNDETFLLTSAKERGNDESSDFGEVRGNKREFIMWNFELGDLG